MIIEFAVGDDANLLEHELTRDTTNVVTVWREPGVFRLVGPSDALQRIVEDRWAQLPDLPPAKLILAE